MFTSLLAAAEQLSDRAPKRDGRRAVSLFFDLKTVRDPLYDKISMNELERAIFRTREFQRLRYVKQMDFASLVYPAAEHSRFTHSLGVSASAKRIFDSIVERQLHDEISGKSVVPVERRSLSDFLWADRVAVSLAALLHDIGHPPFSHAFEIRSDVIKHDDFERNPFLVSLLFDTTASEVARVLEDWTPYYQFLLAAEIRARYPDSFESVFERLKDGVPSLASLVAELLAFKTQSPNATTFRCLCPLTATGDPLQVVPIVRLSAVQKAGWQLPLPRRMAPISVQTSALFRAAHCDIIANTMSADLLDYIQRDTRVSGIQRDLDTRFYSFLSTANHFGRQRVVVQLEDRQGHIRRDVLSELIHLIEVRYTIHERIVLHRTVVAARAMAARLYEPFTGNPEDNLERLYGTSAQPYTDVDFLSGNPAHVNSSLAELLKLRHLYRPIVILDEERCGRHGLELTVDRKQSLAAVFGTGTDGRVDTWRRVIDLESRMNELAWQNLENTDSEFARLLRARVGNAPLSISACMKESVLFKSPRVLVQVPTSMQRQNTILAVEEWLADVVPLDSYGLDSALMRQIQALNLRYGGLWKLYIFANPILFEEASFNAVLWILKEIWEKEICTIASFQRLPSTVPESDFTSKSRLQEADPQIGRVLWKATSHRFPELNVSAAVELLRAQADVVDFPYLLGQIEQVAAAPEVGAATRPTKEQAFAQFAELVNRAKRARR